MEWFQDDRLWRALYPVLFSESRFREAQRQAFQLQALTRIQGGDALDLGCGPGRHAVALARSGFRVTGVDFSEFLLNKGAENAHEANVFLDLVHEDMRGFIRPHAFDLVVSLSTSFGYFENRDDDLRVLANVRAMLRPGGTLLLDTRGKEIVARDFEPARAHRDHNGVEYFEQIEITNDWSRARSRWTVVKEGQAESYQFQVNLYSGLELRERLLAVGFSGVRLYGSFERSAYGPGARRLVALAKV
ncbi:MAG: class I SAM-dependent methyltransferase [Bryobacteraceae bacterium]|nr:class I SAM-dependent methyltransferase [Bryobacteraceae bacterium]